MTGDDRPKRSSAALLTPVGRGAVASIRLEIAVDQVDTATNRLFRAANGKSLSQQSIGRIAFGNWGRDTDDGEDVVVCRRSRDTFELHCHGGDAAVRRILKDLADAGCQTRSWQQQATDSQGNLEAECADRLSRASTWRTAEILHEQASGVLRQSLREVSQLMGQGTSQIQLLSRLQSLLDWAKFGLHLSTPWTVVLTGRPNVGKSSLINALLGYDRAIVFDQPGTTRDVVTAETAFEGWPVLLADTAGLREASEELEAAGIAKAREQLDRADARLVLVDLSQPPTAEDEQLIACWPDAIIVGHKCDLADCWGRALPATAIRASSITGVGLDEIARRLVQQLVHEVPAPGTAIPITERQVTLIEAAREKVLAGDADSARAQLNAVLG